MLSRAACGWAPRPDRHLYSPHSSRSSAVSSQKISPILREALWEAYGHKCIYSGQLVGLRDCHIDHIVPEALFRDPPAWATLRAELGLADGFDPTGIENLAPCLPGSNLQKSGAAFPAAQLHYFLGVAGERKAAVLRQVEAIERRLNLPAARLLILLEQGIAAGMVGLQDVDRLLQQARAAPQDVFRLSLSLHFGSEQDVREIALGDIDALKRQPITLPRYAAFDGVTLTHDQLGVRTVRTCDDYLRALADGYYTLSNYDIKMSSVFEQRCGLLNALTNAATPSASFIAEPRVGVAAFSGCPRTCSRLSVRWKSRPGPKARTRRVCSKERWSSGRSATRCFASRSQRA